MNLLDKLLQKRGVKSPEELDNSIMPDGSPNERQTFEEYRRILSEGDITVDKISEFCQSQISTIESKWKDLSIGNDKKAEWIPIHNVYSTLLLLIKSPTSAKEALEAQLKELVK